MNPRSRALLGARLQGDGLPIAKVAARLTVSCTLDELDNDITGATAGEPITSTISSPRSRASP